MFVRLFQRVYAGGGDTVQVGFFSWVDLVLAFVFVFLSVSLAATVSMSPTAYENIDTQAILWNSVIWWALILGPILLSLRFRGFKLGSVFGIDKMPVGRSLLLGISLLISAYPTVFAVGVLTSILLKINPTTDVQEVMRIFENATAVTQPSESRLFCSLWLSRRLQKS